MADHRILLIEGKQTDHPSFFLSLKQKGYDVNIARNGVAALEKMRSEPVELVLIDAASIRAKGERIIGRIKKAFPDVPVILILDSDQKSVKQVEGADIVLSLPFTIRKLTNRIEFFFKPVVQPVKAGKGVAFDEKTGIVIISGRKAQLTQRMAALFKVFLENPGEVLSPEELYKKAWYTDCIVDIRTLYVHIRFLREAIEEDPCNPKLLVTVRKKGYRFSPPE